MSHSGETSFRSGNARTPIEDWRGLGDLITLGVEQLTAPVEGMHRAIADRWFGLGGSKALPLGRAYQALAAGVYESVRLAGAAVGTAVGLGAAVAGSRGTLSPLWRTARGSTVQAVVNAVWGDELQRRGSDLSLEVDLRDADGETVDTHPTALARAFPEPSGRLVVLLHGLGQTERCWEARSGGDETAAGLGDQLTADAFTPLRVRYNTGRHVSDSGAGLAALLEEVVQGWPVAVEEVALLGSSMGGLVARSSIHAGRSVGHRWVAKTRHVVTLGAPHLGAPLEKLANLASWGLSIAPESRPLASFLDGRSAGIKDLRFGIIREEDWFGVDPDALLTDLVGDVPMPQGIEQHFVAGVVTADPAHPVGVLVGDLIVRVGSGTGRARHRRIEGTDVRVVGGRRHFDLLHDSAVHRHVRDWLNTERSG